MATAHDPLPWPARLDGRSASDRAVALAGLLAERGVKVLVIRRGNVAGEVRARVTNLPAALIAASPCDVELPAGETLQATGRAALRYRVTADSITLESA